MTLYIRGKMFINRFIKLIILFILINNRMNRIVDKILFYLSILTIFISDFINSKFKKLFKKIIVFLSISRQFDLMMRLYEIIIFSFLSFINSCYF